VKVRLTTDRVCLGTHQYEGDEIEVADDEGQRLIISGQGELIETAMRQPATENAMARQHARARRNQ
jgi:hypothetical protein